jgi:hypothetical protein
MRPTYRRTLALVIDRDELPEVLNRRGLLGTGVEVGVRKGEFSERILSSWSGKRLISVDAWSTRSDPDESAAGHRANFDEARERLARFGDRSEVRRVESTVAADAISPASLDFVYIDARHEYQSVAADIAAWAGRVRSGGLLCGHDYFNGVRMGQSYGVRRAVDEFCASRGIKLATTRLDHPETTWFARI